MRDKDFKQFRTILFNSILTNSTVTTIRVMDFTTSTNIHFVHLFLVFKVRGNGKAHKLVPMNFANNQRRFASTSFTPFAVHYEKIRIHLRETATNSAKIHSIARKSEHLRINQIQQRFLHFNQLSITFLGIDLCHSAYKREKYTFINANIRVINIILKIIRDNRQTFKCKRYSLTFL